MLTELTIKNFAIIDFLSVDFESGLTVFTGETGAGKSIIFDALELAMGGRSDSSLVRQGERQAEVTAVFDAADDAGLSRQLDEMGIESSDRIYLRRVVNQDGRSKAYLDGTPIAVTQLKTLRPHLVEIHGQNQHQAMTQSDEQLSLLDRMTGEADLLSRIAACVAEHNRLSEELDTVQQNRSMSPAELELINLQINELETVAVPAEEVASLHQRQQRLSHADDLQQSATAASRSIEADDGAVNRLDAARQSLQAVLEHDAELSEAHELIETAIIQIQEASSSLARYSQSIEVNPEQLARIESQLVSLHALAKKHLCEPEELINKLASLKNRLASARDSDSVEKALSDSIMRNREQFGKSSLTLSRARQKAARRLSATVTEILGQLGMAQAEFRIRVEHDPDGNIHPRGLDRVQFLVRTNAGSAMDSLAKIASGGELSRIALAIKVALGADNDGNQSGAGLMIFDEVDTGTGGAIAQIIGEKLRTVAADRQVFCITHLAQVAACGHQHVRISKLLKDNVTLTLAQPLDQASRVQELARMIGGKTITEQTTAHANELLAAVQQ